MPTCAECMYAELQCPPVIRCKVTNAFRYLDSPDCESFKPLGDEGEEEKKTK